VRLSHSHIRIGTFQRFLFLDQHAEIERLIDHVVENYLPEAKHTARAERALALLAATSARVAETGAQWMAAGFVHGVLNTDNINITGESFDYGPWRFLPELDPAFTAAYFDQAGLYAFGRQPDNLLWNLTRLAECLLPFVPREALEETLRGFASLFRAAFERNILRRLGLASAGPEADTALVGALWRFLHETRAPFEQTFFDWYGGLASRDRAMAGPSSEHYASSVFAPVLAAMEAHETASSVMLEHSYFARPAPCTMLIDEVEAIWAAIAERDDWSAFGEKLRRIAEMRQAYGITI
jgi:uncharacterized protein YdiU (UPF0061 family)